MVVRSVATYFCVLAISLVNIFLPKLKEVSLHFFMFFFGSTGKYESYINVSLLFYLH